MTGGLGYVVRRSDLHAALLAPLPAESVLIGRRLVALRQDPAGVDLQFADGTGARVAAVIGADGLNSVVRTAQFGFDEPRYSAQTAYRGVTDFAVDDPGMMREVQGGGQRGAVHPIDDRTAYWWAARRSPQGRSEAAEERKRVLVQAFAGWAGGLPEAIAATPAEVILKNDLCDRIPVSGWSRGRITLLGDAAHPTTPNLGLGGCMAVEDALVLARALRENDGYGPAFAQYEFERHARTARVVTMSRLMGRFGSIRNPALEQGWRIANRLTPTRVAAGMLAREVTFEPGPLVR
jgi:2-polyprenyl-6-methoxyphenol hydroxylase-like FAD-dependent oxidoreductase